MDANAKKKSLIALAVGVLVTGGLIALVVMQHRDVEAMRVRAANLATEIAANRALVAKTPELERQVILQRETDETVRTVLPAAKEMPNFSRALHKFALDAGVRISSLQEKNIRSTSKVRTDFEKAAYTVKFEGDAFQVLAFFNLVETYERFMSIPSFQLSAARKRRGAAPDAPQLHTVTVEIETYVYDEQGTPSRARIDGYERKRDLLAGDIAQRRSELLVPPYQYRGPRNRRDPWIDPRILVDDDVTAPMPIDEQITLVDALAKRTLTALAAWDALDTAATVIAEMKARTELERHLGEVETESRRIQSEGMLTFGPARRRFELEVLDEVERIRGKMAKRDGESPPPALLEETVKAMVAHLERAEYRLAIEAYDVVAPRLAFVLPDDSLRKPFVAQLEHYARLARTVEEFNRMNLRIDGVTVYKNRGVALINRRAYAVDDMVGPDLQILSIDEERIEFLYKGVVVHQPILRK
jgi:Tfp pilus assembly protein PilO